MGLPIKLSAGYVAILAVIAVLLGLVLFNPAAAQEGDDQEQFELGAKLFSENCARSLFSSSRDSVLKIPMKSTSRHHTTFST